MEGLKEEEGTVEEVFTADVAKKRAHGGGQ